MLVGLDFFPLLMLVSSAVVEVLFKDSFSMSLYFLFFQVSLQHEIKCMQEVSWVS